MTLEIVQFPCLQDNYGFLLRDKTSGAVASIDAPDAVEISRQLSLREWTLSSIFSTHWHDDHTGGNRSLGESYGATIFGPKEIRKRSALDRELLPGETIRLGDSRFQVLNASGHTAGHLCYYSRVDDAVFVGDTLFAFGCGRVFEGTYAQMWDSLSSLSELPAHTKVYCAHEYTAANAKFALSIDNSEAVLERARMVFSQRELGKPTVPSTIGEELRTNPFLRAPILFPDLSPVAAFEKVRRAKDNFQ